MIVKNFTSHPSYYWDNLGEHGTISKVSPKIQISEAIKNSGFNIKKKLSSPVILSVFLSVPELGVKPIKLVSTNVNVPSLDKLNVPGLVKGLLN